MDVELGRIWKEGSIVKINPQRKVSILCYASLSIVMGKTLKMRLKQIIQITTIF
jgi:hypothetical protein